MKYLVLKLFVAAYTIFLAAAFVFFPTHDWIHYAYNTTIVYAFFAGIYALKEIGFRGAGISILLVVLGIFSWLTGELLLTYYNVVLNVDPFPSPADWFFVVGYPLILAGFIREAVCKQVDLRRDASWSHVVLAIAAIIVSACLIVFKIYNPALPRATNVANIAYSVGDVLLIVSLVFISGIVTEYKSAKFSQVWKAFFVGSILLYVADIFFTLFPDQYANKQVPYMYVDVVYGVSYLCYVYALAMFGLLTSEIKARIPKAMLKK